MLNKLRDKIIKKISKKSNTDEYIKYAPSESVVRLNMSTRPAYAYCLYHAVKLAKKLNYKSISAIEFGVAGGNGLYFLDLFADQLSKEFDIEIEIYGFDLGGGLPKPKDYKDLPYIFKEGLFPMDQNKLIKKLKRSKIIIGNVEDSIKDFFKKNNPAPIAFISNDLDYYSSTASSFNIFNEDSKFYLPRIFCYFDDVIGDETSMYGEFSGELLAIKEFNEINKNKKIHLNKNLILSSNNHWRYQVYYYHHFLHPKYNDYVETNEQEDKGTSFHAKP
tara:strand:- start:914 stop:1741 length:828 start_codon:yes stop_codon:yes gene_type:complete